MKRAVISDIHGNYEALTMVLQHIKEQAVDEIICLGDIIGYGPDPLKCLDQVMENCQLTILGNHDQAAIFDPEGFNPVAMKAIFWTRDQLESDNANLELSDRRWDFLGELPRRHDEGKYLFVHGSPRDPTNEYVFPEHIYEKSRMQMLMKRFEQYCFQGHTHIPGIFTESGSFLEPRQQDNFFRLTTDKCMINVGSVGQPRDEDPRACYIILDTHENTVQYHRVEYDVELTRQKIHAISDLDNMLGDRLLTGR
ncbi:MAG: metallophosphoesterase family protein [Mariniblastus sp.]|nr:metallophosphoesterase family protein [Mariniblastus sp.]